MIRNTVVWGTAIEATPLKTAEEITLERRAIQAVTEYRLVKDGITTYPALGYGLPDDSITAVKLLEHMLIDALMAEAIEERRKRDGH